MGVCLHHAELKQINCLPDAPKLSINMYAEDVRTSTSYGLVVQRLCNGLNSARGGISLHLW